MVELYGKICMNILIVGLGSIGQRHLRNISTLYPKTKFYAFRRSFHTPSLNNFNKVKKFNIQKKYNITYLKNLNNLNKYKINAAFICSPTSLHIEESIKIINQKIHVFVEKPLGSSIKKISILEKALNSNNVISMIGFQLRFNPIIKKLKKILSNKKHGKLNQILIHHGENIKNFHKYESYKNMYAAKKKLGGGVVLTQIHEIDYLMHLFEQYEIKILNSVSKKVSNLQLDVEDTLLASIEIKKKNIKALCNINLNYYEVPQKRTITLIYEDKKIEADLNKNTITYLYQKNIKKIRFNFKRNDLFLDEVKFFLTHVKKNKKINNSLNLFNGIKTLKFALDLKR